MQIKAGGAGFVRHGLFFPFGPFPGPLAQLLRQRLTCPSQVPPGCPQKMRLQPSSVPSLPPASVRNRNDGMEKKWV